LGHHGPLGRYVEDATILVKHDPRTENPWWVPKTSFWVCAKLNEPDEANGGLRNVDSPTGYLTTIEQPCQGSRDVFYKGHIFQGRGDLLMFDHMDGSIC